VTGKSQRFTEEFRVEAVKQVAERGFAVKDVGKRLRVNPVGLSRSDVSSSWEEVRSSRATHYLLRHNGGQGLENTDWTAGPNKTLPADTEFSNNLMPSYAVHFYALLIT
jgi:hypothetical protein